MSNLGQANRHSTDRDGDIGRIRTEEGSTALALNQAFRTSEPLSLDTVTNPSIQFEFNSPINFTLINQSITCDLGGFLYQVYREDQGTVATAFSTPTRILRRNARTDAPSYTGQISINSGGVFTPNPLEVPVDTIRVLAGGNVKKISNVSGAEDSKRGLPPCKYYILIAPLAGITGALLGVLELLFDEY